VEHAFVVQTAALSQAYLRCGASPDCEVFSLGLLASAQGFEVAAPKALASFGGQRALLIASLPNGALDWERLRKTLAEIHSTYPGAEISITTEGVAQPMGKICDMVAIASDYFTEIRPY
jgi:hypothetical protein